MIQEVKNQQTWDEFVTQQSHAPFLQSWEWGEFQATQHKSVFRFANPQKTVGAQVFAETLAKGLTRWYVPRGPVGAKDPSHVAEFVDQIANRAREEGAAALHVDPQQQCNASTDAKHSTRQPDATRVIGLEPGVDEILAAMKSKTRYNIRVSAKHRVTIDHGTDRKHVAAFLELSHATAKRQKIRLHPDAYYQTMIQTLAPHNMCDVVLATHKGKTLAALLLIKFGDTVTYLHGASAEEQRNVMAPYAAHWFAMQQSKEEGFAFYDLWGVAPEGAEHHPYKSITRFKQGFGGEYVAYPQAIVRKAVPFKFWAYSAYKRIRN